MMHVQQNVKGAGFTRMIPSTFDYLLELITESSRKQDADF
jgi:hypothetical protein